MVPRQGLLSRQGLLGLLCMVAAANAFTPPLTMPTLRRRDSRLRSQVEDRLREATLVLPPPGSPKANYQLVSRDGDLLYLSGHLPSRADGTLVTGKLGKGDLTVEQGYEAASFAALNLLATVKEAVGDLDRVEKVVKIFGIVASKDDFTEQHLVMNGASDVLSLALGQQVGGAHSRSAIGE